MPIDRFFRSVVEDQGSTAIGVILSGTGSDGTLGAGCIEQSTSILHAIFERSCYWLERARNARAHPRSTTDHRAERRRRKS
jgi:chemotaxis response regulator CheB